MLHKATQPFGVGWLLLVTKTIASAGGDAPQKSFSFKHRVKRAANRNRHYRQQWIHGGGGVGEVSVVEVHVDGLEPPDGVLPQRRGKGDREDPLEREGADATLMCVKCLSDGGSGDVNTISSGMEFAVEHYADVMSLSLGIASSSVSERTILRHTCVNALEAGVVAAIAAGTCPPSS